MARGDHRKMIVRDNENRKRFEKIMKEVVGEMGNDKKLAKAITRPGKQPDFFNF
jgi:hypothetical protein